MKPKLKIVDNAATTKVPAPLTEAKAAQRIKNIRQRLLETAIAYVTNTKDAPLPERIHRASDLSGIPRTLIEVALPRENK